MARFHHIGITVSDTDAAVAFYSAVSGGEALGPFLKRGPSVDAATGHPDAQVVLTFVRLDDGALLELAEYRGGEAPRIDPDNRHVGAAHPAIVVDDIERAVARAAALGHRAQSQIMTATAGPMEGWRYVYVLGPDDVRVELLQPDHGSSPD